MAITEWVAAAVAVAALVVSVLAYRESRRARLDTVGANRRQTRAYIHVGEAAFTFGTPGRAPGGAALRLFNTGQTPPLSYAVTVRFHLLRPGSGDIVESCELDPAYLRRTATIMPGGEAVYEGVFPEAFSAAIERMLGQLPSGLADIRCEGLVTYSDVYGDHFASPFSFNLGLLARSSGVRQVTRLNWAGDPFVPSAAPSPPAKQ